MAMEKRFAAVPPQPFTANGTVNGVVTIADTSLFKVKQKVILFQPSITDPLNLEVKAVLNPTQMQVGPVGGPVVNNFTNISAYTVALGAFVIANEQLRPTIISDDYERAVYEEEPTVAKRVIPVDQFGNKISSTNPLMSTSPELALQFDNVGSGVLYLGVAQPGSATSAAVWQIKKITYSSLQVSIQFANGNSNFSNIWNNRTSLTYV
jgi:hypothetical protein